MEIVIILSLIVGLALILIELLVPGVGIFGILGAVFLVISWGLTIFTYKMGIIFVLAEILLISIGLYLGLKKLKRMQVYSKFILSDVVESDKKEVGNLDNFIGKEGVAKTDLRPYGSVQFNEISLDVVSDEGYIKKNNLVKVIKVEDNKLYVKLVNSN